MISDQSLNRSFLKKWPLYLAGLCLVVGFFGLVVATTLNNKAKNIENKPSSSPLTVTDGTNNLPAQSSNAQSGATLQGAAKTSQLLNGKDANSIQQGSVSSQLFR